MAQAAWDDSLLDSVQAPQAPGTVTDKQVWNDSLLGPEDSTPAWTHLENIGSGLDFGFGPEIEAAGMALHQGGLFGVSRPGAPSPALLTIGPEDPHAPGTWGANFNNDLALRQQAQQQFHNENPGIAGLEDFTAGAVPTILATSAMPEVELPGLAGKAIGGLGNRVVNGMLTGAEAGAMDTKLTGGSVTDNALTGAAIGSVIPMAGKAIGMAFAPKVGANLLKLAQDASGLGVDLRPGQIASSTAINKLDALTVPKSANAQQLSDFTRAVGKTVGIDSDSITGQDLGNARTSIQGKFDAWGAQHGVTLDPTYDAEEQHIRQSLVGLSPESRKTITDTLDQIRAAVPFGSNTIPGDVYQRLTQRGSIVGKLAANSDSNVKDFGGQIGEALFDSMARSAGPDAAAELNGLKDQYKNLLTIQPLVEKSGASGVIDPRALRAAVAKRFGDYKWTDNSQVSSLATLGEAGQLLSKPTVQGGVHSAGLPWWAKGVLGGGLGFGEAAAIYQHDPMLALKSAGAATAAMLAAKVPGAVLNSSAFRKAMISPGARSSANALIPMVTMGVNGEENEKGDGLGE